MHRSRSSASPVNRNKYRVEKKKLQSTLGIFFIRIENSQSQKKKKGKKSEFFSSVKYGD